MRLTALGALMGVGEWVRKAARVGLWGWECQESPGEKASRGALLRDWRCSGSIPDASCCGAIVGDGKAQGRGRRCHQTKSKAAGAEVEAQGGLGGRACTGALSLG